MKKIGKPPIIPLLLVEDNKHRIYWFQNRLPITMRLVVPGSAGTALGTIIRDSEHTYGGILLDHDLHMRQLVSSDNGLSGSNVTNAIIHHISKDVPILVHSMNPEKSPEMVSKLEQAGFWVTKMCWYDLTEERYLDWLAAVKEMWNEYWNDF
jgi:hypothetical protein